MKILYPNLNKLDIRCDGRDNIKEQRSCIFIVVPSKKERWVKRSKNNMKDIVGISIIAYWNFK